MDLVTRGVKRSLVERQLLNPGKGIDEFLFPTEDNGLGDAFRLDKYVSSPYGVTYREKGNESATRVFNPGSTELITVPIASEKTPIDEELSGVVAVGMEASESQLLQLQANTDQIIGDHVEAHNMTKFKQALDVVRTGTFSAYGGKGVDLGLGYEFNRDASLDLTYNFTAVGASMIEALKALVAAPQALGMPLDGVVVIMGKNWLTNFATDEDILELRKTNDQNLLAAASMEMQSIQDTYGLHVHTRLRDPGMLAPVYVCSFAPGISYVPYKGASAQPWVPDNEAFIFSTLDKRFRVNRGINYFDENGKQTRAAADLIVDKFTDNDPIVTNIRSARKQMFVPGNSNHTAKSTGTFS